MAATRKLLRLTMTASGPNGKRRTVLAPQPTISAQHRLARSVTASRRGSHPREEGSASQASGDREKDRQAR